jgi:hypothetical protein
MPKEVQKLHSSQTSHAIIDPEGSHITTYFRALNWKLHIIGI